MQPEDRLAPEGKSVDPLMRQARAGSTEALGILLEECRKYLLSVADRELDPALRAKTGGSDIVQEAFAEAQRIFARFQGQSSQELLAWLRGILLNKLAEARRHYAGTAKRLVGREMSLDNSGAAEAADAAGLETPSEELMRDEQSTAVRAALARLAEHYREVIVWREWDELTFAEIGSRLGKSEDAVRMLWGRALERLAEELRAPP